MIKKNFKLLTFTMISSLMLTGLTGCTLKSDSSDNPENQHEVKDTSYLENLEDQSYYVRHRDNTFEKPYLGDASFSYGDISTSQSDDRTTWFKDDWKEIPTLYQGDSLIFYSTSELDETFCFERFEDFGYTIGIRGLEETISYRFQLPVGTDKKTTYPESETDELLNLTNETVMLDSISGKPLRAPEIDEEGNRNSDIMPITRCGTLKGLTKGMTYDISVYDGTKGYTYKWKADVRLLGSMATRTTNNYSFDSETVINIAIPEDFNSGYYMINGTGIFRYVKEGNFFNENMDFNVPNAKDIKEDAENFDSNANIAANTDGLETGEFIENDIDSGYSNEYIDNAAESSFDLEIPGTLIVSAEIDETNNDMGEVTAILISPSGSRFQMIKDGNICSLTFVAEETGTYIVKLYGMKDSNAKISASYVESGD